MRRTTISLEESELRDLKAMAFERGTSIAALIREAIEEKLASRRVRPRSIGIGASGYSDTAERAGGERTPPRSWR